jgi:hypothetical protein
MRKPVFFRMKEGGGACTPRVPPHTFTAHVIEPDACNVCGYLLHDHPYWEEQVAAVVEELRYMAMFGFAPDKRVQ